MNRLFTAREVADWFGLTVETVLRWTRRGDLPAIRVGGAIRYREQDLHAWLRGESDGRDRTGGVSQPDGRTRRRGGYAPLTSGTSANPPPTAATTQED